MTQALPMPQQLAGNPTKDPEFFVELENSKGQKIKLADPKATRAMVALMDMNAVMGGAASHYGGPAAFAELMSALHGIVFDEARQTGKPWYELYNLVNDAGHCENGLYALKANYGFANLKVSDLKKFRSIESKLTGHGESHLFPEAVQLSNGPLGSALPQSQGLAMADRHLEKNRVTVTAISDGACMEGEAREALAAIPGFARHSKLAPFVMIISDNNTKLSGRIDQESFSMQPTFASLSALGWKVLLLEDGHDLKTCFQTLTSAIEEARSNPQVPIVVHAKTIKGIGTKKTAESSSGGHGFPLKSPTELAQFISEIYDDQAYPTYFQSWIDEMIEQEKKQKSSAQSSWSQTDKSSSTIRVKYKEEKIQLGISNAMVKARKSGLPIVSITSDLPGSTGVAGFRKEFPQDSFDVGIAESNMVSVAAGFSKMGFIPFVDTFAQFGVTKGALPLTMANLSEAPIFCVYSHTGFQDAADGASHQALSYLAMAGTIPNCEVYCLTCSEEAEVLTTQAIEEFARARKLGEPAKSYFLFLGRENFPSQYKEGIQYQLGKAQIVHDLAEGKTKSISIFASGSMMPQALKAAKQLEDSGVACQVVNPGPHNKLDMVTILNCLEKTHGRFIVVEDHQEIGGFGQTLCGEIYKRIHRDKIRSLAVHGKFGQSAYNAIDLYRLHQIDAGAIVKSAKEILS